MGPRTIGRRPRPCFASRPLGRGLAGRSGAEGEHVPAHDRTLFDGASSLPAFRTEGLNEGVLSRRQLLNQRPGFTETGLRFLFPLPLHAPTGTCCSRSVIHCCRLHFLIVLVRCFLYLLSLSGLVVGMRMEKRWFQTCVLSYGCRLNSLVNLYLD